VREVPLKEGRDLLMAVLKLEQASFDFS